MVQYWVLAPSSGLAKALHGATLTVMGLREAGKHVDRKSNVFDTIRNFSRRKILSVAKQNNIGALDVAAGIPAKSEAVDAQAAADAVAASLSEGCVEDAPPQAMMLNSGVEWVEASSVQLPVGMEVYHITHYPKEFMQLPRVQSFLQDVCSGRFVDEVGRHRRRDKGNNCCCLLPSPSQHKLLFRESATA